MPKLDVSGIESFASFMKSLEKEATSIIKMGVYDGAAIITDAVRDAIDELPVDHGKATDERQLKGLNKIQKRGLQMGLGISGMDETGGSVNVKIGFNGYNDIVTKKYPKGQPNVLVARSIESGSSVSQKHPFVRPALNKSKTKAVNAVQETISKEIEKLERG